MWSAYRKKYGPYTPVRMFDQAGALIASQINRAFGGKATPNDFMPYKPKEIEEENATPEEFIAALGTKGVKIGR